jgi:hypothetical protein
MGRPARPEDIDEIAMSLPEVELGTSWGDRPTYRVPRGPQGKGFLLHRMPHQTAVDPAEHLPFFTIDHFRGSNAVLVQQSRLGEIDRDELAEIITQAWAATAPRSLVKKYLADG